MRRLGLACVVAFIFAAPSFIKQKKKVPSVANLKQTIAQTFTNIIDTSADTIARITRLQKISVDKVKTLVDAEESFFTKAKAHELQQYLDKVRTLEIELKNFEQWCAGECSAYKKDYSTDKRI